MFKDTPVDANIHIWVCQEQVGGRGKWMLAGGKIINNKREEKKNLFMHLK